MMQNITLTSVDLGCVQIYVFYEPSTPQKHIPRVMIVQPRHLLRTKSSKTFWVQEENWAGRPLPEN